MKDIKAAAVNFKAEKYNIEANLANIREWAERLSRDEVEVIAFPEMSVTGYINSPDVRDISLTIPGPVIDSLTAIASEYNVILITGLPEIDGDKLYISQVAVAPEGIIGKYRKTHLSPRERKVFQPGEEINVFEYDKFSFGIQICYDSHFPEVSTVQALSGAEVLFIAFASPRDNPIQKKKRLLRYLRARAYDNSCYVVSCNLVNQDNSFAGVGLIIDPKGRVIAENAGWKEGYVGAYLQSREIERIKQTEMGYFLSSRRTELYKEYLD